MTLMLGVAVILYRIRTTLIIRQQKVQLYWTVCVKKTASSMKVLLQLSDSSNLKTNSAHYSV